LWSFGIADGRPLLVRQRHDVRVRIRAVSEVADAQLLGINVTADQPYLLHRTRPRAVAGILYASYYDVPFQHGIHRRAEGVTATILGSIGSIPGNARGFFLVSETFGAGLLPLLTPR
jgi:branched-subunit amino acid ABC-type transport system permease component